VVADGALDEKTKQLVAVAVAHVTQCPYCIPGHTKAALRKGADEGAHGGDMGGCGDARRRCVRALEIHSQTRGIPWHTVCSS
jgi:AhpD family alkylhydroperoxidase